MSASSILLESEVVAWLVQLIESEGLYDAIDPLLSVTTDRHRPVIDIED